MHSSGHVQQSPASAIDDLAPKEYNGFAAMACNKANSVKSLRLVFCRSWSALTRRHLQKTMASLDKELHLSICPNNQYPSTPPYGGCRLTKETPSGKIRFCRCHMVSQVQSHPDSEHWELGTQNRLFCLAMSCHFQVPKLGPKKVHRLSLAAKDPPWYGFSRWPNALQCCLPLRNTPLRREKMTEAAPNNLRIS